MRKDIGEGIGGADACWLGDVYSYKCYVQKSGEKKEEIPQLSNIIQ